MLNEGYPFNDGTTTSCSLSKMSRHRGAAMVRPPPQLLTKTRAEEVAGAVRGREDDGRRLAQQKRPALGHRGTNWGLFAMMDQKEWILGDDVATTPADDEDVGRSSSSTVWRMEHGG